jgi:hypothetical protein
MDSKKVDKLNILLILFSLIIAITFPFKLFLFSYAFLGPIHYLTEINWLSKNGYFIQNNIWKQFYLFLIIIVTLLAFLKFSIHIPENILSYHNIDILLIIILLFSSSFILFKKTFYIIISLLGSILIALLLDTYDNRMIIYLGLFIPSLIHVFLFTLFFMIYGAIKSNSKIGYFCCLLLILASIYIILIDISPYDYKLSKYTSDMFKSTSMQKIINFSTNIFGTEEKEYYINKLTTIGVKTQIFIAFSYTYHYLNWFSKTSIIGWKTSLSKNNYLLIIFIWLISIALYITNYETGYAALFILSFIHVLLEFPLNFITIKEVFLSKK